MRERCPKILLASWLLLMVVSAPLSAQNTAPGFHARTVDGERVRLQQYLERGPVLLDFWATWCQPCMRAFPHLRELHGKYEGQGFTVLAISIDNTRSVSKVRPFVRARGFEFPVLLDTDSEILRRFGGRTVPYSVLISQDGGIVRSWIGYQPGQEEQVERELRRLLEPPPGEGGTP